ncbi:hypothetical protein GFL92_01015 [Rhizobium leguminosarum bv. viciae]|nr:hypothetical protein [Rhizobium leguminosarum bv. viciae]
MSDEHERGAFRWICTLARKMGAKSFLVEDAFDRLNVSQELSYLWDNCDPGDRHGDVRAVAITFLSKGPKSKQADVSQSVIAQAILITFPRNGIQQSYVFEASIRLPSRGRTAKPLLNNYLPLARDLKILVSEKEYSFKGIYFCEQNGTTTLCAHSALKVVAHAAFNRKIPAKEIQELLGGDVVQAGGVKTDHLMEAFQKLGLNAVLYNFKPSGKKRLGEEENPWPVLCSAIEAGHPALLIVETQDKGITHVLPVLGYTLNSDEWHPHASDSYRTKQTDFLSSSEWIDHLIINDDLMGPLYCLSQSWLKRTHRETRLTPSSPTAKNPSLGGLRPRGIITLAPDQIEISAPVAEKCAYESMQMLLPELNTGWNIKGRWWRYLVDKKPRVVFRTTVAEKQHYLDHLMKMHGSKQSQQVSSLMLHLHNTLPDVFWLSEVSLPNLYAGNRAKLGEVCIRISDRNFVSHLDTVVGFRFPGIVGFREGDYLTADTWGLNGHSRFVGDSALDEW